MASWRRLPVHSALIRYGFIDFLQARGGRELEAIGSSHQFDITKLAYYHSMRHIFKGVLGEAGVSSEISEALASRRYGSSDAEQYDKLKKNQRRLALDGIEPGLVKMAAILDEVLSSA